MNIKHSFTELIGNTPLFAPAAFTAAHCPNATLLIKLECMNPAGSVKDRTAVSMIDDAEKRGLLRAGATVIEPTSGNTGTGLAAVCASRGYRLIITMPDTMSPERRQLIEAYGAKVILTPGALGMKGAIQKADELAAADKTAFVPRQFENPSNPRIHYETTGPEIWADTDGRVDIFVAGVGTGGTLTGAGKYLKERSSSVSVVAVEPQGSPILSGGKAGPHKLQGIGAGFVPGTLDTTVYDRVFSVSDSDAYATARELASGDGILLGISSGAAVFAAAKIAAEPRNAGKIVVALAPDTGTRYFSTGVFEYQSK